MKNNIKKRYGILILIWLLLTVGFGMVMWNRNQEVDYQPRVCGGDWCFMTELARTPAEQQLGLMNRESMEEGDGMLFIFEGSEFHNFWMKNTLIPLDMIWIDDQFKVVKIITAQPCTAEPCMIYNPQKLATYVLEINAGMAEKHGIVEGNKMKFVNIQ